LKYYNNSTSGGEPIFLAMSGTVYNGVGSSCGADGNIYGGAMSSSSGSATTSRPPQIGRNSIYAPGYNNLDFRIAHNIPIQESIYMQFSADAFQSAQPPDHHLGKRHILSLPQQRRQLGKPQVQCKHGSRWLGIAGVHRAIQRHGLSAFWRYLKDQQRPLRRTPDAIRREAVLLARRRFL
jgi:hypothetical protein